jgi:hypothetical protein
MPAAANSDETPDSTVEESEAAPTNPLEAVRRAQANRSLPPGSGNRTAGRSGSGKGANPKAPKMYNRHK